MIAPLVRLALFAWYTLHGSFLFGRGFVDWSVLCACYRKPRMAWLVFATIFYCFELIVRSPCFSLFLSFPLFLLV